MLKSKILNQVQDLVHDNDGVGLVFLSSRIYFGISFSVGFLKRFMEREQKNE
jgi:hypothetical protein